MSKFLNISALLVFFGILAVSVISQPLPKITTTSSQGVEYLEYQWFSSVEGYFERDTTISEKEDMYNHLFEKNIALYIIISLLGVAALFSAFYYLLGKLCYHLYCKFRVRVQH